MTLWTKDNQRSSASTGARISPGKFSPTSPKGGFVSSIYEGARYYDANYGYNAEGYYRKRLFGNEPDDVRWRYDFNKRLIGRPDYKSRATFPWQPRYPKQKYSTSYSELQKGNKRGPGFGSSSYKQSSTNRRGEGFCSSRSNQRNRCRCPNWVYYKIHRYPYRSNEYSRKPGVCKCGNSTQNKRPRWYKPRRSRW